MLDKHLGHLPRPAIVPCSPLIFYLWLMSGKIERSQTLREEFANSITHGFGILFSVVGISLLVTFSVLNGSFVHVFSCSIYGASILLLYTFSTLYHAIQTPSIKRALRIFDHISIYFLIAGTYTPFLLISLGGLQGWIYFGVVWGLTLVGIVFKVFYTHRFARLSLILYLSMGWIALLFIRPLIQRLDPAELILIAAGGISYTFGIIFYTNKTMRYAHTIWHIFVLAGTIIHFLAIMLVITSYQIG